jgi:hypothetical protein
MGRQGLWLMQHKVTAQALQEKGSCSAFAHLVTAIYFFKDCFSREEIKLVLNAPFWSGILFYMKPIAKANCITSNTQLKTVKALQLT